MVGPTHGGGRGEGAPGYLDLLAQTLRDEGAERVSDVLITHYHKDHTEGLREIAAAFGPALRVWKVQPGYAGEYGPSFGADLASGGVSDVRALSDGDVVRTENGDAQVRVVATPGHTPDHACFVLEAGDEAERAVFTGDCVLGGSSAVFENLADYMRSLHTLARLTAPSSGAATPARIYPGHGPVIDDGRAAVAEYIRNRDGREAQVVSALSALQGSWWRRLLGLSALGVVARVYPPLHWRLRLAAGWNVHLHLRKLAEEGRVKATCLLPFRLSLFGMRMDWLLFTRWRPALGVHRPKQSNE